MAVPSPRNSIRIARGSYNDLLTELASLGEGEICYAKDQDRLYVVENGILTAASATAAQGVLADTSTQPGDNVSDLTNDAGYITLADVTTTADNFVYVNSTEGNDATGTVDDPGKPFLTIAAAIAAIPGPSHKIIISPGTYSENNPLIIPTGCILSSSHGAMGWLNDNVLITPLVNTANTIELSASSTIEGVTVQGPTAAGFSAIMYAGANGTTASVTNVGLKGAVGGQGNGISVEATGSGKIISFEIRFKGGEFKNLMQCLGGILATESVHVPNVGGTNSVETVFYQDNSTNPALSRFQLQSCNTGNSNVTYVYRNNGGTAYFFNLNAFNAANGILLENDSYNVNVINGLLEVNGDTLITAPGISGSSGTLTLAAKINKSFNVQNPLWWTSDHNLSFATGINNPETFFPTTQIWGGSQVIGHSREPGQIYVGYGAPHTNKTSVFATSNNTSTTEGNSLVDVTVNASDKDEALTFSFNSNAADEAIYFCTAARDKANNLLKHYGYCLAVLTGDSRDGEYIYEIWSGSQLEKIYVQSTSAMDGYNYANDHFWRSNNIELQWTSIDENTAWSTKTINGVNAYWSRIRIVSSPTTTPVFYHLTAVPDGGFIVTFTGKQVFFGKGQFRRSTQAVGNALSASGGVLTGTEQVGTGVNQWSHQLANSTLDGIGDRLHWQYQISEGTCTAQPIYFNVAFSIASGTGAATLPTLGFSIHKSPVVGMLVADKNGGKTPVPRTNVDTGLLTDGNPTNFQATLTNDDLDKIYNVTFGPYFVEDAYEGDMLACYLELLDDGSANSDITVWNLSVRSFRWTEGERQV
jgi:hypothetical protein